MNRTDGLNWTCKVKENINGSRGGVRGARAPTLYLGQTVACKAENHQRTGRGGWGAAAPPVGKENSIIRAKLMYRSGKDRVQNILLFNILIYLFSSRISHNLLTDLCTTSRDGCYYSKLEH